jgi:hypothetical protein
MMDREKKWDLAVVAGFLRTGGCPGEGFVGRERCSAARLLLLVAVAGVGGWCWRLVSCWGAFGGLWEAMVRRLWRRREDEKTVGLGVGGDCGGGGRTRRSSGLVGYVLP